MDSQIRFTFIACVVLATACGGAEEFSIPEAREEALALLDAKNHEVLVLKAEIAQLERAVGGESLAANSPLVAVSSVIKGTFEREIELQATVESDETGIVTVEVPGRVSRVLVEEGQYVKRGQVLLRVEQESLGIQMAEVQTNIDLARDLAARQERLRAQNIGTEVQLLEARNSVERLEKQLAQLRVQQGKSIVTAPISGTIENKSINPGEIASPGMPLMQILDAATVKVVADVPETYLRSVKKGQTVRVKFPALELERSARVSDIGRTIDAANRTFRVELAMSNSERLLKPNMLANVYLIDYKRDNVVSVPSEAILEETDGREYVYIARPVEGKPDSYLAKKSYVTTGENDATSREVLAGLEPGQILVTTGMRSITDNQPVRIQGLQATAKVMSPADSTAKANNPAASLK